MTTTPIFSLNKYIFTNSDMTGNLTSEILDLGELTGYAVHAIWSGDPDGLIIISGSNTMNINDFVPVDSQLTDGEPGSYLLNVEKAHYKYVVVEYAPNSGSGSLNCLVSGKRV
jgi:hypothetical protein